MNSLGGDNQIARPASYEQPLSGARKPQARFAPADWHSACAFNLADRVKPLHPEDREYRGLLQSRHRLLRDGHAPAVVRCARPIGWSSRSWLSMPNRALLVHSQLRRPNENSLQPSRSFAWRREAVARLAASEAGASQTVNQFRLQCLLRDALPPTPFHSVQQPNTLRQSSA